MVPGASTRSWPSIYIPPWAGGVAPIKPTQPRVTRAPVGLLPTDPVVEGGDRDRHFHQLLRQLRLTENRTRKAGWPGDLGHCDNLLACSGNGTSRICRISTGWFIICSTGTSRDGTSTNVSSMGPRCAVEPFLWPRRLCQAGRPPPAGLLIVQTEEHRLERRGPLSS